MPTTRFTVHTRLSPSEVMTLLTDFGPDRPSRWPNIDEAHYAVHDQGEDWAEVTEGTSMGWERERYSWDAAAGTVTVDTLESNLWGLGSSWHYTLTPGTAGDFGSGSGPGGGFENALNASSAACRVSVGRRAITSPSRL